jgi:hypothetical protein
MGEKFAKPISTARSGLHPAERNSDRMGSPCHLQPRRVVHLSSLILQFSILVSPDRSSHSIENMNHPVLAFATVAAMTAIASGNEFLCDIPTAGCANGMFNQVTCSCDCIPPFCPDALGNCLVSGTCEDPWTNCTRGKNCPWWSNTLKAESCTTGPKVSSTFYLSNLKLITPHGCGLLGSRWYVGYLHFRRDLL